MHSQILHLFILEGLVNNELGTTVLKIWFFFKWPLPSGNILTVPQDSVKRAELRQNVLMINTSISGSDKVITSRFQSMQDSFLFPFISYRWRNQRNKHAVSLCDYG